MRPLFAYLLGVVTVPAVYAVQHVLRWHARRVFLGRGWKSTVTPRWASIVTSPWVGVTIGTWRIGYRWRLSCAPTRFWPAPWEARDGWPRRFRAIGPTVP